MRMAVLVLVAEGTVARDSIEDWRSIAVGGIDPRFLNVFGIAGAVVPIVGIIADRHDDLVARNLAKGGGDRAYPPLLGCNGSSRAIVRMLVVGHDEQLVGF